MNNYDKDPFESYDKFWDELDQKDETKENIHTDDKKESMTDKKAKSNWTAFYWFIALGFIVSNRIVQFPIMMIFFYIIYTVYKKNKK